VNYALRLAGEVRQVIEELPIDVQEDLWDLFENIAAHPRSPDARRGTTVNVHRYRYVTDAQTFRVDFALVVDDGARVVFVPLMAYGIA
jgi:hypothetical protein